MIRYPSTVRVVLASLVALVAVQAHTVQVHAQEPLTQNDFEIDAVTTPVLASGRITGLSGAYTALAEGIDGAPYNPASYAARPAWEHEWWEWDVTASLVLAGSFSQQDFFNNGLGDGFGVDSFIFLDLGFRLQFGDLGLGALLQVQSYDDLTTGSTIGFQTIQYGGGYSLLDGQLVVGVGARTTNMNIVSATDESLVSFTGTGAEVGALLRLDALPFRVGAALRTPVDARVIETDGMMIQEAGGFVLPRAVALPWEIQAGFAFQLGRRINHRHIRIKKVREAYQDTFADERCAREREQLIREGHAADDLRCPNLGVQARDREWRRAERLRQRDENRQADELGDRAEDELYELWEEVYDAQPRQYFLVSVDLLVQGPTDDGIGIDAFLLQERRRRGAGWHFGFRLGVEGEPWANRMKLRAGTYLEPGRYQGVDPRLHGTAGIDVRLFELFDIDWRASFTVDGAREYVSWGVGVGVWH